jgi:hypothetical protein
MVWMPNGATSGASDSIHPSTPNFAGVAERFAHGVGPASGRDDGVAGGERRFHDVDAHAAAGTGHEPDVLVSHRISTELRLPR